MQTAYLARRVQLPSRRGVDDGKKCCNESNRDHLLAMRDSYCHVYHDERPYLAGDRR